MSGHVYSHVLTEITPREVLQLSLETFVMMRYINLHLPLPLPLQLQLKLKVIGCQHHSALRNCAVNSVRICIFMSNVDN